MLRKHFLLKNAQEVSRVHKSEWKYDNELNLNVLISDNSTPACSLTSLITGSKTEALPGDDDPDPDAEFCY